MTISKKILLTFLVLITVTVMALPVSATDVSATRTLPAGTLAPGEEFTVTITASNYGTLGQVVETLPAGFSYVSSTGLSLPVDVSGNTVTFYLTDQSFSYNVKASNIADTYCFTGDLNRKDQAAIIIGGATEVTVAGENGGDPECASASRTLPTAWPLAPGEEFTVIITASDYGSLGQVVETLPAGFSYMRASGLSLPADVSGNTVTFYLFGETSFSYNVTASDTPDTYCFAGALNCRGETPVTVGGDTEVTVAGENGGDPECASASRTLPAGTLAPGEEFMVTITASDYGILGQVVETLPAGFSYVNATGLSLPVKEDVSNNTVTFYLSGTSFSYNVTASDTPDTYCFAGVLNCRGETPVTVGGDTEVIVADVIVIIPDEDLCLKAGWNFVSIPYTLENPRFADILAELPAVTCVQYYDASAICYKWVHSMDLTWEPLKGYWIYAGEDCCIPAEKLVRKQTNNVLPALKLYPGWNAVGSPEASTQYANWAFINVDCYSKVVGPWVYDDGGWKYQYYGYNNGDMKTDTLMTVDLFPVYPYKGYWMYVTDEGCTLA